MDRWIGRCEERGGESDKPAVAVQVVGFVSEHRNESKICRARLRRAQDGMSCVECGNELCGVW